MDHLVIGILALKGPDKPNLRSKQLILRETHGPQTITQFGVLLAQLREPKLPQVHDIVPHVAEEQDRDQIGH